MKTFFCVLACTWTLTFSYTAGDTVFEKKLHSHEQTDSTHHKKPVLESLEIGLCNRASAIYVTVGEVHEIPGFGGWVEVRSNHGIQALGIITPMRKIKPGSELQGELVTTGKGSKRKVMFTEIGIDPVECTMFDDCWPGWGEKMKEMKKEEEKTK